MMIAHQSGLLVGAARSAQGILLLGRPARGVGLLSDLLIAVANDCELPVHCEELQDSALLRPLNAAAIWLGASEAPQAPRGFDVVMAIDSAATAIAYRLVRSDGRILLPSPETEFPLSSRFSAFAEPQAIQLRNEQASIGYLAGCLSACTVLPERAWRAALESHVRPRDRRPARTDFALGRQQLSGSRISGR